VEIANRFRRIYREGGVGEVFRRALARLDRSTVHDVFKVYCWDLSDGPAPEMRKIPLRLVPHTGLEGIDKARIGRMDLMGNLPGLEEKLRQRFERNATLWLLEFEGKFCGFAWTIRGGHVDPYYFPLTRNDVLVFDVETFPEFRGKGIISEAICRIGSSLAQYGVRRLLIDTGVWNHAMQKGLTRTPFRQIGTCRKFTWHGKTFSIWSDLQGFQETVRMDCAPIE
jgi:hypothetical protein